MACNDNNQSPDPPPPPLERRNYPPAPPPTPIIQETRAALDITHIVFEEEFSFPVVVVIDENASTDVIKVMPEDVKNETPKEASPGDNGGSRKRKAN